MKSKFEKRAVYYGRGVKKKKKNAIFIVFNNHSHGYNSSTFTIHEKMTNATNDRKLLLVTQSDDTRVYIYI